MTKRRAASQRRPESKPEIDSPSFGATQLLLEDIRVGCPALTRTLYPLSSDLLESLSKKKLLPKNVSLLAHVLYPEIHFEYIMYVERWSGRHQMLVLS